MGNRLFRKGPDSSNLLALIRESRRYQEMTNEELQQKMEKYERSFCYQMRNILSLEQPVKYRAMRYEIRERTKEKIK